MMSDIEQCGRVAETAAGKSLETSAEKPIVAVTGASRGIGHAIVKSFYNSGWEVLTLARTPFSVECPWADGVIRHVEVDLSDEQSLYKAVSALEEMLGDRGLDALVNNAGISPKAEGGGRLGAVPTSVEVMKKVQMVNLIAPMILTQQLLPSLIKAKGAIVNVSSIAAFQVHPFAGAAYATSKAALSALTREFAHELGTTGVRVNAVAPGEIKTSILSPGTDELIERDVPMKRLGSPEEVAEVIQFLCSEKAAYVNGTEINIDGGQHV